MLGLAAPLAPDAGALLAGAASVPAAEADSVLPVAGVDVADDVAVSVGAPAPVDTVEGSPVVVVDGVVGPAPVAGVDVDVDVEVEVDGEVEVEVPAAPAAMIAALWVA